MQLLWKELVKSGAYTNIIAFINGYGPLTCAHLAAKFADVDLLATYLTHGGDIDVRNAHFGTPLQQAHKLVPICGRCEDFFQAILDAGAHVDVAGRKGRSVHDGLMKSFKAGGKFLAFSE